MEHDPAGHCRCGQPAGESDGCFLSLYGKVLRMGRFDWDLVTGHMTMDATAHEVFDVDPDEYDGRPESLAFRVPTVEAHRLDADVSHALKDGSEHLRRVLPDPLPRRRAALDPYPGLHPARRDGPALPHPGHRPGRHAGTRRQPGPLSERADEEEAERRRTTTIVQGTTAALAHARTVRDVIDVLRDTHGLAHLGASNLVMGLVEAGRDPAGGRGTRGQLRPGTRFTSVDEHYPMSEVVRTLSPRFIETAGGVRRARTRCCGRTSTNSASPRPRICR